MTTEQTEWKKKVDSLVEMVHHDAESRQQALSLLDALAESIAAANVGAQFISLFSQPDTVEATFGWMTELRSSMSWSKKRAFDKEEIFWPLYDIMFRVYPDKALNLPSTLAIGKANRIPTVLTKPNSVQSLVLIDDAISLDRLHKLDDVKTVSFNMRFWQFDSMDWKVGDLRILATGIGDFRLLGPDRNALVYEDVGGVRFLRVATGIFQEDTDYPFEQHERLQVTDIRLTEEIRRIWNQKTQYNFLDLGIVQLELFENEDLTIAERLTAIHLKSIIIGWDDVEQDVLDALFKGTEFPRLTKITGCLDYRYSKRRLIVSSEMLHRMPLLHTIYLDSDTTSWTVRFEDCDDIVHPLSAVIVSEEEHNVFYIFEDANNKTLKERLTAVGIGCRDEDFLIDQSSGPQSLISNVPFLHLFHTSANLSMIRNFTKLKDFHVELDPYQMSQKMKGFLSIQTEQAIEEMGGIPIEVQKLIRLVETPSKSSMHSVRLMSLSDLQIYYGGEEPYTATDVLENRLKEYFEDQSFPEHFISWVKSKGMVRVGRYCLWLNTEGHIRLKAYQTWGEYYFNHVKTYGGSLNLERVLFGLPQGVSTLFPITMKSIRYNDSAISPSELETVSNLMELRIEIPINVEDICNLDNLEVLYLNDLGLTSLPDALGDLTSLKELHIWGNDLTTLPDSILNLQNLRVINISGNAFTRVPESLLTLPQLRRVIWRGGTQEWERMTEVDSAFAKRVEDGEIALHDADIYS